MKLAVTTLICFSILVFVILAAIVAPAELYATVTALLRAIKYIPLAVVAVVVLFALVFVQKLLERNTDRQAVERGSRLEVVSQEPGHTAYTFDHQTGEYRNLTLTAGSLFGPNGQMVQEAERWMISQFIQAAVSQPRMAGTNKGLPALLGTEDRQPIDLFTYMRQVDRGLIVGNPNAGKTNFIKWIALESLQRGKVFVLDPHSAPSSWPPGVQIVGAERNHVEIRKALTLFVRTLGDRYGEIGREEVPEMGHEVWTVLVDEYMSLNTIDVSDPLSCLLREGRKANVRLFVGSHDKTVKSLGLKGAEERKGFATIILHWDQMRQERHAWVELPTPDGKTERVPAILPPEFAGGGWRVEQPSQVLDLSEVGPEGDEAQVIQLFLEGNSMRDITGAIWGQHGTFYNDKVKTILEKWEIPASQ